MRKSPDAREDEGLCNSGASTSVEGFTRQMVSRWSCRRSDCPTVERESWDVPYAEGVCKFQPGQRHGKRRTFGKWNSERVREFTGPCDV